MATMATFAVRVVGVLRTTDRRAAGEEGIVRTVGRGGGYGADAMTDVDREKAPFIVVVICSLDA